MLLIPAGVLCFKFSQEKYISGVVSLFKSILSAILLHTAWTYLFPNNFGMFQTSRNILKCIQTFHKVQNLSWEYFCYQYSKHFELFSNKFGICEMFITIWIVWRHFLCKHFYRNTLKCFQIILEYFNYSEHFELFSNSFRICETFIAIWIVWRTFFVLTFLGEHFEMFPNNLIIQNTLNCYQTNSEYVKPAIWIVWWIFFG